jgi:hypothetical protein
MLATMYMRTALVVAFSTAIAGIIRAWWENFKERKAQEPTPLVMRKGSYVPWGPVEKIKHYGWKLFRLWFVYVAVLALAVIYVKLIAPNL